MIKLPKKIADPVVLDTPVTLKTAGEPSVADWPRPTRREPRFVEPHRVAPPADLVATTTGVTQPTVASPVPCDGK